MERKPTKWVRSQSFSKIFASSYGITKNEDIFRIDVGDEMTRFGPAEDDFAFVSEVQIITNTQGIRVLRDLLNEMASKGEF